MFRSFLAVLFVFALVLSLGYFLGRRDKPDQPEKAGPTPNVSVDLRPDNKTNVKPDKTFKVSTTIKIKPDGKDKNKVDATTTVKNDDNQIIDTVTSNPQVTTDPNTGEVTIVTEEPVGVTYNSNLKLVITSSNEVGLSYKINQFKVLSIPLDTEVMVAVPVLRDDPAVIGIGVCTANPLPNNIFHLAGQVVVDTEGQFGARISLEIPLKI